MSSSTAGEVSSSSVVGEVGSEIPNVRLQLLDGGIPNRILVDGAPFDLLHLEPPSLKLQHNHREAAWIQGDGAPFGLLHPASSSANLRHNQAAMQILCDGTPFGLRDLAVIDER
jgi:hypothetical protein